MSTENQNQCWKKKMKITEKYKGINIENKM